MVGLKHPKRGSKFSLKAPIAAAIAGLPPRGYTTPPTLIDGKTIDPSVLALRAKNYATSYKICTPKQWNNYVAFGIQEFVCPHDYYVQYEKETEEERHLRLARYYRLHVETKTQVEPNLLKSIGEIEITLQHSHPLFLDMCLADMDQYLKNLNSNTPMEDINDAPDSLVEKMTASNVTTEQNEQAPTPPSPTSPNVSMAIDGTGSSLAKAAASGTLKEKQSDDSDSSSMSMTSKTDPPKHRDTQQSSSGTEATTTSSASLATSQTKPKSSATASTSSPPKQTAAEASISAKSSKKVPSKPPIGIPDARSGKNSTTQKATPLNTINAKRPAKITNIIRIETRWAPKDFNELRASTSKTYLRLAPILSCFNNEHTWIVEWQTEQMGEAPELDPAQLSKYLSIRIVPVVKDKCFYFSFRINATGAQFMKVAQSQILQTAKKGESLIFDPSCIPTQHGELVYVGDILLKDAAVTQRSNYLKYLRAEVIPAGAPAFDLKVRYPRHSDGRRTPMLTVRCGKSVSITVAEMLSTSLCGEGCNPEIFISRIALGANHTSRIEHDKIYQVHHNYLADLCYLPVSIKGGLDSPATEHLDSDETLLRTPRQWAQSLVSDEGEPLEAVLENGTEDGNAVLLVPSVFLEVAKAEIAKYWQRQDPTLSHATKLYSASVITHPDIPMSVFTKNIDTLLARSIRVRTADSTTAASNSDEASTVFSPVSSLTGGMTSKGSKGSSIAWKTPLQETLHTHGKDGSLVAQVKRLKPKSSVELNQLKRIAILEAQLAINQESKDPPASTAPSASASRTSQSTKGSRTSQSKTSRASSLSTEQSPLTAASAHSRLDTIEHTLTKIQRMLQQLTVKTVQPPAVLSPVASPTPDPVHWPTILTETADTGQEGMSGMQVFPPEFPGHETRLAVLESPTKPPKFKRSRLSALSLSPNKANLRPQYNDPPGPSGGDKC